MAAVAAVALSEWGTALHPCGLLNLPLRWRGRVAQNYNSFVVLENNMQTTWRTELIPVHTQRVSGLGLKATKCTSTLRLHKVYFFSDFLKHWPQVSWKEIIFRS